MALLKNKLFLIFTFLFLVNYLLEKGFGIFIPFIHAYLDDLLCMPVVLKITLALPHRLINTKPYRLSGKQIIFAVAYFSIVFEVVLPKLNEKHTADVLDVFAYALGAILFYLYMNNVQGSDKLKAGNCKETIGFLKH